MMGQRIPPFAVNGPSNPSSGTPSTYFVDLFNNQTAAGTKFWQVASQAGVAETIAKFGILDDTVSQLQIGNYSATNAVFEPLIYSISNGLVGGLVIESDITTDTVSGNNSAMRFQARLAAGGASIANRILFEFYNGSTPMMQLIPSNSGAGAIQLFTPASNIGAPTFTTRSIGTRVVYYPAITGSSVDYASGIQTNGIWHSVTSNATSQAFSWYGGTTLIASLRGDGLHDNTGTMRSTGATNPSSGSGVETYWTGTTGFVGAYNRTAATYQPLAFQGSSIILVTGGNDALTVTANTITANNSDLVFDTANRGVQYKSGANGRVGTSTLVGGTVTVANTSVTANTKVRYWTKTDGGTVGNLSYTTTATTGFTLTSSNALDTSTIDWKLEEVN